LDTDFSRPSSESCFIIGAAGAFGEGEMLEAVRGRLALPAQPDGQLIAMPPEPLRGPGVMMRRRKTEQAHICLGVRAFSYLHPDLFVLDLLNTVLGEGMSSRLFLNIRERLGLAYDVHSFTQKHRDTGLLGVYLGVDPKQAVGGVNAVIAELQNLCDHDLAEEELVRANFVAREIFGSRALIDEIDSYGSIKTIEEEVALVDAITAEDVRRVANDVLRAPIQMAVVGPFAKDLALRAAVGA